MEKNSSVPTVPYIVHESMMARQERTIKRLWILVILLILLLFGSNAAWIWYESQFIPMRRCRENRPKHYTLTAAQNFRGRSTAGGRMRYCR